MKKIGVAILGLGKVGGGVYKILTQNREFYRTTQEVDFSVESVLEPCEDHIEEIGVPKEKVVSNVAEAVLNPDVQAVVECIGGAEIARNYVLAALKAGKTVLTSNRELISKYSHELERAAKAHNAGIYYGASCLGGIPAVRTLLDGAQSNEITRLVGIVGGSANFVLSDMAERGVSFGEALEEAKKLGISDDLAADVDGTNAAYELSILASIALHTKVPFTKIFREGIGGVTKEDIEYGASFGYTLKPLAVAKRTHAGVEVRVHPAFLPEEHPLSAVGGTACGVSIQGKLIGEVMLRGNGAGELATASAIVTDLIFAATHGEHRYSPYKNTAAPEKDVVFTDDFTSAYFMRLTLPDQAEVLPKVFSVLAKCGVPLAKISETVENNGTVKLLLVTHETHESAVKGAVAKLTAAQLVSVDSVIRIEQ